MKQYQSFKEIETDLKRLSLEQNIAWEEMKLLKGEFQESLTPANWLQTGLKMAGKYGMFLMAKRFFK
ncbi:DUF6327 family protein [Bizionia arctica]|uniref:Glutaminyl-tRNA synthetase n=1 Tax=Bizionia arctica TaxID=1495645 RepID=A0A917GV02_9FLAO|nr:DUF6327 family protein [Bizionia arctica]GGG58191.1 hypothetical protein GCM10010976_31300 [Bizionia arctica]